MTEQTMELVTFAGRRLMAVKESATVYVALKPICEALGIDWDGHRKMVIKDDVLGTVAVAMTATGADGKRYQMLCLPLDYLNGWLFRIKASHFPESKRALIVRYQRECYRALAEHFQSGRAEAAVAAAVMAKARASELADRRNILKQLGGILANYNISAATLVDLVWKAAHVVHSEDWHPGLPLEAWAEEGSEAVPELLRRSNSMLNA